MAQLHLDRSAGRLAFMCRLCAIVLALTALLAEAFPCFEPDTLDPTALERADPTLVTWTSATSFTEYPPTITLPTKAELETRRAKLEARNSGFTVVLDVTGRLVQLSSKRMPCAVVAARAGQRFTQYASREQIPPWFDALSWALELRNWDALGHLAAPTKANRSTSRVTFEGDRFFLTFTSDPRPTPRAGKDLSDASLRKLMTDCRIQAARSRCAPCAPPGPCHCATEVKAKRPCGLNLVFTVKDHFVDQNGVRRYLRVATAQVDATGLTPFADAPWSFVGDPQRIFDAVVGNAEIRKVWIGEGVPIPVAPLGSVPGMEP